ncbi:Ssk22p [Rhizophagus irregularis DAOM 197198w]|uniref:Ssk22p n=2 Tax=Rhizophagus irregularis TaxID=588596 RepID=A0A015IWY9_RHIIW|nr:Ssk22p [Rhizophagus irregularis DAOM 197198w]
MDLECNEHEISRTKVPQSIQECCVNCVRILCFKQLNRNIISYYGPDKNILTLYNKVIESEKYCKLCGKSLYQGTDSEIMKQFKLCSDCYLISSGCIESTLVKKQFSILYLPWWHDGTHCDACDSMCTYISDCQKYCANCYIFYTGCRYCLTTNIIFGPVYKSQCKKCKRISSINSEFDDFIFSNIAYDNLCKLKLAEFSKIIKNIDKYFRVPDILSPIFIKIEKGVIEWIPYSQFTDIKEIAKGGYGIIYKATWLRCITEIVVLKRFEKSKNMAKYFLNELKLYQQCCKKYSGRIIKTYGFTKDSELNDYILVMKYASEGDLHKYLQKNFTKITWNNRKLHILWKISRGNYRWRIGDLGLSQAVNNKSFNDEIYGVIPYIGPEIFKGSAFSKEADIYSFGMIIWELTTGCKPFYNVEHDHTLIYKILDGERPRITDDTPECYASLMKSCWDADPKKRPSIKIIRSTFDRWAFRRVNGAEFDQAEAKRTKLIKSKKIGPEFAEKRHSEAIYTSRPLSALISKCTSIYSSSTISFGKQGITKKIDCNINSLFI